MDNKERQLRQREFTIYLVLFILLVIVGAITTNGQMMDGRRYDSPYGPSNYGGYNGSPYNYSGYAQYGSPYYGGDYRMPSYAWNQLHGYGNGPPYYQNGQPIYGHQWYGQGNPVFGPQGGHPDWGFYGGGQIHPRYGDPAPGYHNNPYGPTVNRMPLMQNAYPNWGNEAWGRPPQYPVHPMMGPSAFMGPFNSTPYFNGFRPPVHPHMQQFIPNNQVWW